MSNIFGNSDCCERWALEINLQATAHSLTKLYCGNEPLSLSCLRAPSCKAFTGRLRSPSCQGCRSRFRAPCSQGLMSFFQASLYGVDTTTLKMSSLFDNPSSVCCNILQHWVSCSLCHRFCETFHRLAAPRAPTQRAVSSNLPYACTTVADGQNYKTDAPSCLSDCARTQEYPGDSKKALAWEGPSQLPTNQSIAAGIFHL